MTMQRSESEQTQQYIAHMGALLTDAVVTHQTVAEQQAVATLGAHVAAARAYQNRTRRALACRIGISETDLLALEQGLLPYVNLTEALLLQLAGAIGEDVELLRVLLFAGHYAAQKEQLATVDGTADLQIQTTSAATLQQSDEMSHTPAQKWAKISGWGKVYGDGLQPIEALFASSVSRLTTQWLRLCSWGSDRYRWLGHAGKWFEDPLSQPFAHAAAHAYRYPVMPFRFGGMMIVVLCCFLMVNLAWPTIFSTSIESTHALPGVREEMEREQLAIATNEVTRTATPTIARVETHVGLELRTGTDGNLSAVDHASLGNQSVASRRHYHIIYTMDVQNDDLFRSSHLSPVIPVSSGRIAMIDLVETVPKIFLHCRVTTHLNSCPM